MNMRPDRILYEKCPLCDGTKKTNQLMRHDGADVAAGSDCPLCKSGLIETGLSSSMVERWVELARAIQGDPGIPAERRKRILETFRDNAAAALERL